MLNTQSAYFVDQLAEKLQLMLATRELQVVSYTRFSDQEQQATFYLPSTQEDWSVDFPSEKDHLDLPKAIQRLASDMAEEMNARLKDMSISTVIEGRLTRD